MNVTQLPLTNELDQFYCSYTNTWIDADDYDINLMMSLDYRDTHYSYCEGLEKYVLDADYDENLDRSIEFIKANPDDYHYCDNNRRYYITDEFDIDLECSIEYRDENYMYCEHSNQFIPNEDYDFDLMVSEEYRDRYFYRCESCGDYQETTDNMVCDHNTTLCMPCYENNYFTCDSCDCICSQDSYGSDGHCESCASENKLCPSDYRFNELLDYKHPIDWSKTYKLAHENTTFLGIELETEAKEDNEQDDIIAIAKKHLNGKAICMYDGSLTNGVEIITSPMTLDYINQNIDFKALLSDLNHIATSHNGGNCGLHVHVNHTDCEFRKHLKALIVILYNNGFLLPFTRRKQGHLDSFARIPSLIRAEEISEQKKPRAYYAQWGKSRYGAINCEGDNTTEFRMFRGTLKHESFNAALQFVDAAREYCEQITSTEDVYVSCIGFGNFLKTNEKYSVLVEYLKTKKYGSILI